MPPRLAISRKSFALPTCTPSQPSTRISALFVRRFVSTPAFSRPPMSHSCWAAPAAGGMRVLTEYAGTRPSPFLVGISGVLESQPSAAAPRDPQPYPLDWDGVGCCAYPMRGVSADRGSPPPQLLRRAQDWVHRLDVCGVQRPSRDHREAPRRARRREHQAQHQRVRPSPQPLRRPCRSPTVPIAPAPSGRSTALHCAAYNGRTKSVAALLVGGADQNTTNNQG
jgi:hypothetical protein